MPALVKAKRSADRWQIDLRCLLLPCRRDSPGAQASTPRLIVDSGSARTHIRRQGVKGTVKGRPGPLVYGLAGPGHCVEAQKIRAHLLFFDGEAEPQLVTAEVLVIAAEDPSEDGVIGLDLLRHFEFHGDTATVGLATSDAQGAALGRADGLWPTVRKMEALVEWDELRDCGCHDVLRAALKATGL